MGDQQPNGDSSAGTSELTDRVKIPDSLFSGAHINVPFQNGGSENLSPSERASLQDKLTDQIKKHHSLHGAVAAKRQATTELLFFASVGDISRIQRICDTWGINVRSPTRRGMNACSLTVVTQWLQDLHFSISIIVPKSCLHGECILLWCFLSQALVSVIRQATEGHNEAKCQSMGSKVS